MNKDVIYPSMVIRVQEETINKLEEEVNKQAKAIQIYEKELRKHDNNWNKLKKWLNSDETMTYFEVVRVKDVLDKIKELENDN